LLAREDNGFALLGKGMYQAALVKEFSGKDIRQITSTRNMQRIELLTELTELPDRGIRCAFRVQQE